MVCRTLNTEDIQSKGDTLFSSFRGGRDSSVELLDSEVQRLKINVKDMANKVCKEALLALTAVRTNSMDAIAGAIYQE